MAHLRQRKREKIAVICWYGVEKKSRDIEKTWGDGTDEDKKKLKTYFERFSESCRTKMQSSIFLLEVSQESTNSVRNNGTVCDRPKASGERMLRNPMKWFLTELSLQQTLVMFEKKNQRRQNLTLDKTVDIARTYELSQSQTKSMEVSDEVVHSVKKDQRSRRSP